MYTLVTRNEKNFDERGVERAFAGRAEAIQEAKAFIARATCAGASAHVFFRGYTEFEATPTKVKEFVR